jgi:hypothetical protein
VAPGPALSGPGPGARPGPGPGTGPRAAMGPRPLREAL